MQAVAPQPTPPPITTCRDAVASVWPVELQDGAITVLDHENPQERVDAVGAVNNDGSQDFGCFQINNRWHKEFFDSNDWKDPIANAREALSIYQGRIAQGKVGWSAWYAVEGILW